MKSLYFSQTYFFNVTISLYIERIFFRFKKIFNSNCSKILLDFCFILFILIELPPYCGGGFALPEWSQELRCPWSARSWGMHQMKRVIQTDWWKDWTQEHGVPHLGQGYRGNTLESGPGEGLVPEHLVAGFLPMRPSRQSLNKFCGSALSEFLLLFLWICFFFFFFFIMKKFLLQLLTVVVLVSS